MNPMMIAFEFYLVAMLFIGWLGYRNTDDLSDYILGGRKLGSLVTGLAAGASDMSGWLLMGLPGLVYLSGISGIWIGVGGVIGAWLNWTIVAARLRLFTEKFGNALTIPEYLSNRFNDEKNLLRMIAAIAILIFFTFYCASGIIASSRLFENLFHIPYNTALWIGALATITYVFVGGFLAVSWTDTIQASLMITALIFTPLFVIYKSGGLSESIHIIQLTHPVHTALFTKLSFIQIISFLAWGLGYFGQPHILVRFMATSGIDKIPNAKRISITWMILCLIGAIAIGFFSVAYFILHPHLSNMINTNAENVFIEISRDLFNPWIAGFLLAAILAAVMSTLSCQLLLCSSALTKDIYKTFFRKKASQRELVICGRLMVLLVALIAIFIAKNPSGGILNIVSYAWAGFGSAFGPVILFSLLWPRMTASGALAGIIVGTMTVIFWGHYAWFGLFEIVPGFLFASLSIVIISKLSSPPHIKNIEKFNEIKLVLQNHSSSNPNLVSMI